MVCPCEYEIVKSETALCESDNNGQKSYIQIKSEIMGVNSEKTHIYMYPGKVLACSKSRQNLRCSLIQAVSQEESSDRNPDPWPL